MPSLSKGREFIDLVGDEIELKANDSILDKVIEWIGENIEPDFVYDDLKLRTYVENSSLPDDVFTEKALGEWAEENGYIKQ